MAGRRRTWPTYVLIPGAGGDGWQWHLVVARARGERPGGIPVTLPSGDDGAGWNEYADAVVAAGDRRDLVLVAQSLAGFTAPLVCERSGRPLVLLNAMIPRPGETGNDWWANPAVARRTARTSRRSASTGTTPDDRVVYFHDVPDDVVGSVRPRRAAAVDDADGQPWPLDAWPDVPTRVLAGRDDRLFPVDFQRRVARERLGIEAEEIEGGHMLALSHPSELAEQLERYREQVARA